MAEATVSARLRAHARKEAFFNLHYTLTSKCIGQATIVKCAFPGHEPPCLVSDLCERSDRSASCACSRNRDRCVRWLYRKYQERRLPEPYLSTIWSYRWHRLLCRGCGLWKHLCPETCR